MRLRIFWSILIPPVFLFLCAFAILWMPLPSLFPPSLSSGRNQMAAVTVGVLGMGCLIGLAIYVVASFRRVGNILDSALAPAGWRAGTYLLFGRRYVGALRGRRAEITFLPARFLFHPALNVHVAADARTRIAISGKGPLVGCRGCRPVPIDVPGWENVQVYAEEEASARRLLTNPEARHALTDLMSETVVAGLKQIYLEPDQVWARARPQQIAVEHFGQWLESLARLVEAAQKEMNDEKRG